MVFCVSHWRKLFRFEFWGEDVFSRSASSFMHLSPIFSKDFQLIDELCLLFFRAADKIVSLKNGEIAEVGTHDTLRLAKGYYHSLVMKQLKGGNGNGETSSYTPGSDSEKEEITDNKGLGSLFFAIVPL